MHDSCTVVLPKLSAPGVLEFSVKRLYQHFVSTQRKNPSAFCYLSLFFNFFSLSVEFQIFSSLFCLLLMRGIVLKSSVDVCHFPSLCNSVKKKEKWLPLAGIGRKERWVWLYYLCKFRSLTDFSNINVEMQTFQVGIMKVQLHDIFWHHISLKA